MSKGPNSSFSNLRASKSEQRGSLKIWKESDRGLSGQKCFNFRGVLIGDKIDAWILMLGARCMMPDVFSIANKIDHDV